MAGTVSRYQKDLCIREYHIYKDIWEAAVGETLVCALEPNNSRDRNAVAVEKEGKIVGHLPLKVSCVCTLFLKRGGSIRFTVTGRRRVSADLTQGGLEVPCTVVFVGLRKENQKLNVFLSY